MKLGPEPEWLLGSSLLSSELKDSRLVGRVMREVQLSWEADEGGDFCFNWNSSECSFQRLHAYISLYFTSIQHFRKISVFSVAHPTKDSELTPFILCPSFFLSPRQERVSPQ